MEKLEVIASFDWLEKEEKIGELSYESKSGDDIYFFEYERDWLRNHPDVILDSDLQPWTGLQESHKFGIFGCLNDCLPDYWGRLLIELKEREKNQAAGQTTIRNPPDDGRKGNWHRGLR